MPQERRTMLEEKTQPENQEKVLATEKHTEHEDTHHRPFRDVKPSSP